MCGFFFKNQTFCFETIVDSHAAEGRNTEQPCVRMKVLIGTDNERREKKRLEGVIKLMVFISGSRTLNQTCRKVKSAEGHWMG